MYQKTAIKAKLPANLKHGRGSHPPSLVLKPSIDRHAAEQMQRNATSFTPPTILRSITSAMVYQSRSETIKSNPIGKGLDAFRASFSKSISCKDALDQLDHEEPNFRSPLSTARPPCLSSASLYWRRQDLFSDLSRLNSAVNSDDFDFGRTKPLLNAALLDHPDDAFIWDQVYKAVAETIPPPRPIASSLQQTPWLRNISSFANSSEYRKYVDDVLKEELGLMYVGLRDFDETYFGDMTDLKTTSEAFFKQCMGGGDPLFDDGWRRWPRDANQDNMLSFTTKRKMDIGFVSDPKANKDFRYHWLQILIPGELKSNPSADTASKAWLDLGRLHNLWIAHEDMGVRSLGGFASEQFDISKDGLRLVSTILGFLWMSEERLGFNPTIITSGDKRYIGIGGTAFKDALLSMK
ncbi:hypothetical protein DL766_009514 [Monosporascus sp. MC13-8B]|uniref:Fungal-type protein kinase domain-containing protein n=1 Tax=Monosporascus cannonballus TaxID=155416 RepID=A0ABY0GVJ0_9PEZI|nr:hypothetical protein DL762_008767 [Monosporascus cannonballus]RYO84151.1 hypothetical protein DL763_007580 [Monosporascus cannonballus]RYP15041.1 hypothetical protein DL766_009514 [Monosporascus sp. MC13-8B]